MIMIRGSYGIIKRDFAPELNGNFVALPSLCSGLLTADKREIKDFPKSRQVGISFIRETLSKMSLRLILLNGTRASSLIGLFAKRTSPISGFAVSLRCTQRACFAALSQVQIP